MNIKPLIAFALSMLALTLHAQEKFNLEFKYRQGDIYRYKTVDTFTSQQEVFHQEMNISGGGSNLIKMEVMSIAPDSAITFNVSFEKVTSFIKSSIKDTTMDEKELTGIRSTIILSKLGKEISRKLLDSVDNSGVKISMNTGSKLALGLIHLPGHPVMAGEKWSAEIRDSTMIGDEYNTKTGTIDYTILGTEQKNGHSCLKIEFVSKYENSGKLKEMGMDCVQEGSGEEKGTLWFDAVKGLLIFRESNVILDLTFAIIGPMSVSIQSSITLKSSMSLVEN